jgi:hypothetical protein
MKRRSRIGRLPIYRQNYWNYTLVQSEFDYLLRIYETLTGVSCKLVSVFCVIKLALKLIMLTNFVTCHCDCLKCLLDSRFSRLAWCVSCGLFCTELISKHQGFSSRAVICRLFLKRRTGLTLNPINYTYFKADAFLIKSSAKNVCIIWRIFKTAFQNSSTFQNVANLIILFSVHH